MMAINSSIKTRRRPAALTRTEKAEATQQALLDSAVKVIGTAGYAEASIAKITQEANVAQGTFYNYFSSQQEIFDALLPIVGQQLIDKIREIRLQHSSPLARERVGFETFFEFLLDTPEFYRLLTEAEVFAPKAHRAHTDNMVAGYVRTFRRLKTEGWLADFEDQDFEAIAYMLIGMRHYLAMRFCYRPDSVQRIPAWVAKVYTKILDRGLFGEAGQEHVAQPSSRPEDKEPAPPSLGLQARLLNVGGDLVTAETLLDSTDSPIVQAILSNLAFTAAAVAVDNWSTYNVVNLSMSMMESPVPGRLVAAARIENATRRALIVHVAIRQHELNGPTVAAVQITLGPAAIRSDITNGHVEI